MYDVLNEKFAAPRGASAFGQIRASLKAWRALRRSTDPSTKEFLLAMERIRREYDGGIMALTDAVQPLTEEEVRMGFERAGGRELQRAIEEGVEEAFTMQQALEDALQKSLQPLNRPVRRVASRSQPHCAGGGGGGRPSRHVPRQVCGVVGSGGVAQRLAAAIYAARIRKSTAQSRPPSWGERGPGAPSCRGVTAGAPPVGGGGGGGGGRGRCWTGSWTRSWWW